MEMLTMKSVKEHLVRLQFGELPDMNGASRAAAAEVHVRSVEMSSQSDSDDEPLASEGLSSSAESSGRSMSSPSK